jgi:hypothetical protein
MTRFITILVQLLIGIPALYFGRMMYEILKQDFRDWENN